MVPFAGYMLPVRYSSLRAEHEAVRNDAGLFDVSHMGELFVEGKDALDYLQYITCNNVAKLKIGRAQYSALLNDRGGVIDDIIVYALAENRFLLCVNASNVAIDFAWCRQHAKEFDVRVEDQSKQFGQVALQGPKAVEILKSLPDLDKRVLELTYFSVLELDSPYGRIIVARTGYTGEDGFEIFVPNDNIVPLWNDIIASGSPLGLLPCGLGARDTLRLEACYPLHGHELSPDISALESGLGWIVKFGAKDFIGKEALLAEKQRGVKRTLCGFFVTGKGLVREGTLLEDASGVVQGEVTSGTLTPTLNRSLGLAFVPAHLAKPGTELQAQVRGRSVAVLITETPFYQRS